MAAEATFQKQKTSMTTQRSVLQAQRGQVNHLIRRVVKELGFQLWEHSPFQRQSIMQKNTVSALPE